MSHHPILMGIGSFMVSGYVSQAIWRTTGVNAPLASVLGGIATVAAGWKLFPDYDTSIAVGALLGCTSPVSTEVLRDVEKRLQAQQEPPQQPFAAQAKV